MEQPTRAGRNGGDEVNEHWKTVEGWFDFQSIYDAAVEDAKDGDIFVEVGVFKGKSLCYLAAKIKESGKRIKLFGIDLFVQGSEIGEVRSNISQAGGSEFCEVIQCDSARAAGMFRDQACTFVFIDAKHEYEFVKRDIEAWLPKVKPGGTIAGHDFKAQDWPGVVKAVEEVFGGKAKPVSNAIGGYPSWVYTVPFSSRPAIYFATPWYHETCTLNHHLSFVNELKPIYRAGYEVIYQPMVGDAVNRQRNILTALFLSTPNADPIVMVDTDQGYFGEDIVRAVESDLDVVCVNYPKRHYFWTANANGTFKNGDELRDALLEGTVREKKNPERRGSMLEIDYGGTGVMVIRRRVFEAIIAKGIVPKLNSHKLTPEQNKHLHRFFAFTVTGAGHTLGAGDDLGEDWSFCDLARLCNFKIWCDTEARSSHCGYHTFAGRPRLRSEITPTTKTNAVSKEN